VVISAPDDCQELMGQRVCGDINLACAACKTCGLKTDRSRNHCPNRTVLGIMNKDGTHSQYLTLPVANLHIVPDAIPDEVAVFTEPLAAACRIVEQGIVTRGSDQRVCILGDGKLGLMCAEVPPFAAAWPHHMLYMNKCY